MEDSSYTETFLLWCKETEDLSDDQWLEGLSAIERKINADVVHLRESWPPTAPVFRVMCKPVSTTGGASAASFKTHPNLIAKVEREKRIAADPSYTERKKKAGNETLSRLKDLL
tara:strand:+ start:3514 stop:3855 length:342 start_codon:yes stop_codon:yes gene_type:complete